MLSQAAERLAERGVAVNYATVPGLDHNLDEGELAELQTWITARLAAAAAGPNKL